MSILTKVLRAGEGKKLKALQTLVPDINAWSPRSRLFPTTTCATRPSSSGSGWTGWPRRTLTTR